MLVIYLTQPTTNNLRSKDEGLKTNNQKIQIVPQASRTFILPMIVLWITVSDDRQKQLSTRSSNRQQTTGDEKHKTFPKPAGHPLF